MTLPRLNVKEMMTIMTSTLRWLRLNKTRNKISLPQMERISNSSITRIKRLLRSRETGPRTI